MGREGILGPVSPMAEFAHVKGVRLFVLVLEVSFEGVVTAEGASAVGAFLWLVDTSGGGGRHPHSACNSQGTEAGSGRPDMLKLSGSKLNNYTDQTAAAQAGVMVGL